MLTDLSDQPVPREPMAQAALPDLPGLLVPLEPPGLPDLPVQPEEQPL